MVESRHDARAIEDAACYRRYDPALTIVDCFLAQVALRATKTAVICGQTRLTYDALARRAAQFAHGFASEGVAAGDRIGILAGRSIETIAAQLGAIAIGAVFAPIDPRNPSSHIAGIIEELDAKLVVDLHDADELHKAIGAAGARRIGAPPQADTGAPCLSAYRGRCEAHGAAMIIFTSGTTGRPKGVVLSHRSITRLVRAQTYANLGPEQVMLNIASPGFDVCIAQIYSALLNGGSLSIVASCMPSLDTIAETILRDGVTLADLTPGIFNLMVEHRPDALGALHQIICGGDVMSASHARRFLDANPQSRLVNAYGPTENGVNSTCFVVDETWRSGPAPIGAAIAHDRTFILDERLRPVRAGEQGQLAVSGPGLAIGYFRRPELTAQKFVAIDTGDWRGRVYLTGDLASDRGDGALMFHGRIDRQVKISGVRVELDAVEGALRNDPDVADAVVVAVDGAEGLKKLVAIIRPDDPGAAVSAHGAALAARVMARIRDTLPAAMAPAQIFVREAFPLTASDKVDRRALQREIENLLEGSGAGSPSVEGAAPADAGVKFAPHGEAGAADARVDAAIREIWSQILGVAVTSSDRTFFELGGTSLQLMEAHAALQVRLSREIDIVAFFETPRLQDLVRRLSGEAAAAAKGSAGAHERAAAGRAAMARARNRQTRDGRSAS